MDVQQLKDSISPTPEAEPMRGVSERIIEILFKSPHELTAKQIRAQLAGMGLVLTSSQVSNALAYLIRREGGARVSKGEGNVYRISSMPTKLAIKLSH
jgi:hypothetical protein